MKTLQHSVIHRLPHRYRKSRNVARIDIEVLTLGISAADDDLTGLSLLSHQGEPAWKMMRVIKAALAEIRLDCNIIEWEGQPCLFIARHDESAATCHLKNFGVCIAESANDYFA